MRVESALREKRRPVNDLSKPLIGLKLGKMLGSRVRWSGSLTMEVTKFHPKQRSSSPSRRLAQAGQRASLAAQPPRHLQCTGLRVPEENKAPLMNP